MTALRVLLDAGQPVVKGDHARGHGGRPSTPVGRGAWSGREKEFLAELIANLHELADELGRNVELRIDGSERGVIGRLQSLPDVTGLTHQHDNGGVYFLFPSQVRYAYHLIALVASGENTHYLIMES